MDNLSVLPHSILCYQTHGYLLFNYLIIILFYFFFCQKFLALANRSSFSWILCPLIFLCYYVLLFKKHFPVSRHCKSYQDYRLYSLPQFQDQTFLQGVLIPLTGGWCQKPRSGVRYTHCQKGIVASRGISSLHMSITCVIFFFTFDFASIPLITVIWEIMEVCHEDSGPEKLGENVYCTSKALKMTFM